MVYGLVKRLTAFHIIESLFNGPHIKPAQRLLQFVYLHGILRNIQVCHHLFIQLLFLTGSGDTGCKIFFIRQQVYDRFGDMFFYGSIIGCNQGFHVASGKRKELCRFSRIAGNNIFG